MFYECFAKMFKKNDCISKQIQIMIRITKIKIIAIISDKKKMNKYI